jgi:hypothetical protein
MANVAGRTLIVEHGQELCKIEEKLARRDGMEIRDRTQADGNGQRR